jgi:hypothetical protein
MKSNKYTHFGFFGVLHEGDISNLTIAATVRKEEDFINEEYQSIYIGALAGRAYSSMIHNCTISGSVTGGTAYYYSYTGGIIGDAEISAITDCIISASVVGGNTTITEIENQYTSSSTTGGVVGYCYDGSIKNCTVSGNIMGGVADWNNTGGIVGTSSYSNVSNCTVTASGSIHGTADNYKGLGKDFAVGGIVGTLRGTIDNCTNHATIHDNTFSWTSSYGASTIGGVVGRNDSGGEVHACLNTGDIIVTSEISRGSRGGLVGGNDLSYVNTYDGITYPAGHVYSCCTNTGRVNGQAANASNQIGNGNPVEPCPDGHAKR